MDFISILKQIITIHIKLKTHFKGFRLRFLQKFPYYFISLLIRHEICLFQIFYSNLQSNSSV